MYSLSKKLALFLGLCLFSFPALAADVPPEGILVKQDGTPAAAADFVPPKMTRQNLVPESEIVTKTIRSLEHSTTSVISVQINTDGMPKVAGIAESSGSIILDQYAMDSINSMTFSPAALGGQKMTFTVQIPFHFISGKVAKEAVPASRSLDAPSADVAKAIAEAHEPEAAVSLYVNNRGKVEGTPQVTFPDSVKDSDASVLTKYITRNVKKWTFTPAENPDGEIIGADTTITIPLKASK